MAEQIQGGGGGGGGANMEQFEAYFRRADLDQDGRISGAEAVSFFQGSNLSKQVLAKIWMYADQSRTGYLSRAEFYNALKLVTVAQSRRELTTDIVNAALFGPASAKIPAPQINLAATPTPQINLAANPAPPLNSVGPVPAMQPGGVTHAAPQSLGFRGQSPPSTNMNQQYLPSQGIQSVRPPLATSMAPASRPPYAGASVGPTAQVPNRGIVPTSASLVPATSVTSTAGSSAIVPITAAPESSAIDPFAAIQSTYSRSSAGSQQQQTQSIPRLSQQAPNQVSMPVGGGHLTLDESQPWPKMTRASVQKYVKVFIDVDTDRDGRIMGEQARNLFLSWRLPREILKQIWDLSDQDNDSMLSLKEFCIALYLMEKYKEGRTLPSTLPASIMLDETLLSLGVPHTAPYGSAGWGTSPGLRPQQGLPGSQPSMPAGVRPAMQALFSQTDGSSMQFNQQNARGPSQETSHVNELSNGVQNSLDMKGQETTEIESKVESKEKVILDSKEKLEYYRTKMQDLVLYKSRCDNRLNEITERALADKREAELLAKKYEEKYKQVAEIASKLTIEEASFRDIQERKMELHQAIIKVEQGGSTDGILQVRADRIQSDLEELLKALTDRCKKHGVDLKSTAVIELPPGWQPGVPEIAAVWDEDWDKFDDEGFSFDIAVPVNGKSVSPQKEYSSPDHSLSPDSVSTANKSEKAFAKGVTLETESSYTHSEDESKSPHGSPTRQTTFESPSQDYSDNQFGKSFDTDAESHRRFDDSAWGTFDNNDDIDSVWGFNAKESDHEKQGEKYFFGSDDFGGSPVRTGSPQADGSIQRNSAFSFEDSVPPSPLSRAGNSPRGFYTGTGDSVFDSFSRYDSFSTHDRSSSPRRETLTRFDSMNSTRSFDHGRGFSFDDSDPFGSSGPFKVSSENQTPKKSSENWSAF